MFAGVSAAWVWRSEDNFLVLVLSFHFYMGPKDQAQVNGLGSRSPSLLSHLTELFQGCLLCSLCGYELACPDLGVCVAISMCSILSLYLAQEQMNITYVLLVF